MLEHITQQKPALLCQVPRCLVTPTAMCNTRNDWGFLLHCNVPLSSKLLTKST